MPKMPSLNINHSTFGILNCVLLLLIMQVITIHVTTNVNTCKFIPVTMVTEHVSGFPLCSICALLEPHLSNGGSRVSRGLDDKSQHGIVTLIVIQWAIKPLQPPKTCEGEFHVATRSQFSQNQQVCRITSNCCLIFSPKCADR